VGEWQRLKIGDVCDIVKGETGLASATPGQYPMVATGAERRSCNTYQFDTEAVCIPLVSSTGHGKKTLNYVHYQSGKFALGTILAAVIPNDPKVLTARYLHLYLSHFKDTVLVPLMKGAANVSLPMKGIASVEIPVPTVDKQQKLIDLIGRIESEHRELLEEGERQVGLSKQLRQAVLQEAVEGKLTTDWRRQHPLVKGDPQHDATALLAQIKAEKERLVKGGKIRKEKPLPPIADSDKPFELPSGWAWCRIDEILSNSKSALKAGPFGSALRKDSYVQSGYKVYGQEQVIKQDPFWGTYYINDEKFQSLKSCEVASGDILLSLVGTIGKVLILPDDIEPGIINPRLIKISLFTNVSRQFFSRLFSSVMVQRQLKVLASGQTMDVINIGILKKLVFPLPPLAEQQAIVARVDSLMATIDALESQVTERKEQAQQLMQAVLREAFAGGEAVGTVSGNRC